MHITHDDFNMCYVDFKECTNQLQMDSTCSLWCINLIIFQKMYYCVENIKANDCKQHMDEVGGSLLGSDLQ
jgi:hypothetical protein